MSIEAMSCAWLHSRHEGGKLLVLLAICDNANDEAVAWPGQKYLARKCRVSKRQVQRCVKVLVESGELLVLAAGDGKESARYKVNLPQMRSYGQGGVDILSSPSGGDTQTIPPVTPRPSPGATPVSPESSVNRQQPSDARARDGRREELKLSGDPPPGKVNQESPHQCFVRMWHESYLEHFGETYAFQTGKDGTAVKQLLAQTKKSPRELVAIAIDAWKRSQGFYCKGAASISGFHSKFNEIRQEIKHGTDHKTTTESSRNIGTANEGKSAQYEGVGKVR